LTIESQLIERIIPNTAQLKIFFRPYQFYITTDESHLVPLAYFLAFPFADKAQFLLQKPVRISPALSHPRRDKKASPKDIGV